MVSPLYRSIREDRGASVVKEPELFPNTTPMANTRVNLIEVFQESSLFYLKNILRFFEIISWLCLPVSIFFVLFFYWGISEKYMFTILNVWAFLAALLLWIAHFAVIRWVDLKRQNQDIDTLALYARTIEHIFSSSPVFILGFIFCYLLIVLTFLDRKSTRLNSSH